MVRKEPRRSTAWPGENHLRERSKYLHQLCCRARVDRFFGKGPIAISGEHEYGNYSPNMKDLHCEAWKLHSVHGIHFVNCKYSVTTWLEHAQVRTQPWQGPCPEVRPLKLALGKLWRYFICELARAYDRMYGHDSILNTYLLCFILPSRHTSSLCLPTIKVQAMYVNPDTSSEICCLRDEYHPSCSAFKIHKYSQYYFFCSLYIPVSHVNSKKQVNVNQW